MAAVYLARFQRSALIVDAGHSRLAMIAKSRNVLGFPDGASGADLLELLHAHASRYGVQRELGCVDRIERLPDGGFEVLAGSLRWQTRTVLLATGARDHPPDVKNLESGLADAVVRYCPVCDGYETRGKKVAVLGPGSHGQSEAEFLAGFDNEVTWLSMGSQRGQPDEDFKLLKVGIRVIDALPKKLVCEPGHGVVLETHEGEFFQFDLLYSALGLKHPSQLATDLGANARSDGQLIVDQHMQTSIPGLYAAGDVAQGLNQINVAAGHAAVASTAIHNSIRQKVRRNLEGIQQ